MTLAKFDWQKQGKRKGLMLKSLLISFVLFISASVTAQEIKIRAN
jgi:outer membrane biogenesis lipoprotein LolB